VCLHSGPASPHTVAVRTQCKKCPWRKGVDPHDIPDGYDVEKHKALRSTIAEPGDLSTLLTPLRVMACHDSPTGQEKPCVGWLHNQLQGSNLGLRNAVRVGRISSEYELRGEQHATFDDTLPTEAR